MEIFSRTIFIAVVLTGHFESYIFFFLDQGAASSGGGDGSGHRHVLPFPASEGHEELPTTT